jgi:hypothetical protein
VRRAAEHRIYALDNKHFRPALLRTFFDREVSSTNCKHKPEKKP